MSNFDLSLNLVLCNFVLNFREQLHSSQPQVYITKVSSTGIYHLDYLSFFLKMLADFSLRDKFQSSFVFV